MEAEAAKKNLLLETCFANGNQVCYRLYDEAALDGHIAPLFGNSLDVVQELLAEYKGRSL